MTRPGRGGETALDLVRLGTSQASVTLLVGTVPALLARDVSAWKDRLLAAIELHRARNAVPGAAPETLWPALATRAATPSAIEACERVGVGLLDRRGTVRLNAGPLFVHVTGRGKVVREPRVAAFRGKAERIVRLLLHRPTEAVTAQSLAAGAATSYAYAHGVLTFLERQGLVTRRSPRSGFRPTDPGALLRAWLRERASSAASLERYYAPSTAPEALASADAALRSSGVRGIFTLASALRTEEVVASALPHGLYLSGDPGPVVAALGLKRVTPYNFYVVRPAASADTEAGGVYHAPRRLEHGEGVAIPQLIADLALLPGRAVDQSNALLERWVGALPFVDRSDDGR